MAFDLGSNPVGQANARRKLRFSDPLHIHQSPSATESKSSGQDIPSKVITAMPPVSSKEVVISLIAGALKLRPEDVAVDRPIMELGLDSVSAVTMTVQLEEQLGIPVEPTLILDYETITLLSAHLDNCLAAAASPSCNSDPA